MPSPSNGSTIDITASITIGPGAFSANGKSYTIKPTSAPITVTLVGPITITSPSQCIRIGGNGTKEILIIGSTSSTKINVTCNNYPGLVNNGGPAPTDYGVNLVTIENLSISFSDAAFSLQQHGGFICQQYFGNYNKNFEPFSNLTIENCISSGGNISNGSGGIVGANSDCAVTDCSSLCTLAGTNAGGIYGYKCGGQATNCTFKGTMTIGQCGGIFGGKSTGNAESCSYILPKNSITSDSGGIFGPNALSIASAKNCINYAILNGPFSGGIFGKNGAGSAENCTNNGNIVGNNSGGIFGANSSGKAISCTNKGSIIGGQAAGIIGSNATAKTIINNCKNGVSGTSTNPPDTIRGAGGSGGLLGPQAISGVSIINSTNYHNIGAANSGGIAGIGVKENTLKVGSTYNPVGDPVSFKGVNGKIIKSPAGKNFKKFTI